jgi:hypothetical protein
MFRWRSRTLRGPCRKNPGDKFASALLYRALLGTPRGVIFKHAAAVQSAYVQSRRLRVCSPSARITPRIFGT